jgi:periplasmic protein TonB
MVNATTIVRVADRFLGRHSKNSIARAGFLRPIVVAVSILYMCAFACLLHLEHKFGLKRKIVISNLVVQFVAPEPLKIAEVEKIAIPGDSAAKGKPQLGSPLIQTRAPLKVAVLPKLVVIKRVASPPPPIINPPKPNNLEHTVALPKEVTTSISAVTSPKPPALITAPATTASSNEPGSADQNRTAGTGEGTGSQRGAGGDTNNGTGTAAGSLAMALPHAGGVGTAMGNIAPYRKDMLMRLAEKWHPKKLQGNIVLVITLSSAGQLINAEIVNSSGDEKLDQYALEAVNKTSFAPLPDWFTGTQLRLKVELARVEAMRRGN